MNIVEFKAKYGVKALTLLVKKFMDLVPDEVATPAMLEVSAELGTILCNLEWALDEVEPKTTFCKDELIERKVKELDAIMAKLTEENRT